MGGDRWRFVIAACVWKQQYHRVEKNSGEALTCHSHRSSCTISGPSNRPQHLRVSPDGGGRVSSAYILMMTDDE